MLSRLAGRRIVFFGGKGGVGKTTLAAAYAVASADRGERTLLVSTDPAHSTGDILQCALDGDARDVVPNLRAIEIDPAQEADRYIADVKRRIAETTSPRLLAEVERQIDIARVTPGAEESALFDRFAQILERDGDDYDRLVFDTAPLGHTLRLLALPEQMHVWMQALIGRRKRVNALGRMWRSVAGAAAGDAGERDAVLDALERRRARFAAARTRLTDTAQTAFVFVVVPERLPILETERAVQALERHGIPVGAVMVNRVLPAEAAGDFMARRRARERAYLERIRTAFGRHEIVYVPLQEADVVGITMLRDLAARAGTGEA
ncbi:MAG TPA: ArsA family ATPase [Gemmatimonadales bacterium]